MKLQYQILYSGDVGLGASGEGTIAASVFWCSGTGSFCEVIIAASVFW